MADRKIDNGGHAFPVCFEGGQNSGKQPYFHEGMSLRDWFAGQALVGMMRAMSPYSNDFERSAREAYVQADAMIAARKGGV